MADSKNNANNATQKMWMAIDQYGRTYHGLKHPRKELCQKIGNKHVSKMFVDRKDGSTCWCGYVIGGLWLNLYRVEPLRVVVG